MSTLFLQQPLLAPAKSPRRIVVLVLTAAAFCTSFVTTVFAADDGVRAVVTRATGTVAIDGDISEFQHAVCTPVEYFNSDTKNRPAQFFYLWDDEAFYVGLRTLDEHFFSPVTPLWEGDAVEWYFDTRRDSTFRDQKWGKGSVHCFFTPMELDNLNPRFCLRPGYLDAIPQTGVEVAAKRWKHGLQVEFKLPWVNFPDFQPRAGEVIGVDAELSYSDGGPRSYRSFVFGSPLSVQQPGNLARVLLVDDFQREHWKSAAAVMMPIRIDTSWSQPGVPHVQGRIAMPANRSNEIGKVVFHLIGLDGNPIGEFEAAEEQILQADGNFRTRVAQWPADLAAPGTYNVYAVIHNTNGDELARVAPRMVSVNSQQGY
ncbi:MAG: sugar-binding protein [Planctomycetaceae bacterium]